jgi:hypothetical protein
MFVEVPAPTNDELQAVLNWIITRLMTLLTRRGVLVEDMGRTHLAEPDADADEVCTLRPLKATAITQRRVRGPSISGRREPIASFDCQLKVAARSGCSRARHLPR